MTRSHTDALTADTCVLAVDIGGTTIKAEVVDAGGAVLTSGRAATPSGDASVEAVSRLGRSLADEAARAGGRVARAGVAVPGIVDRDRRIGLLSANLGWRDLKFGEPLETAWGVPVLVDHDVTLAGWAEWQHGAGAGLDDVVFVVLGTGIASAVVAAGRLVRGGRGQAGELGHVVVRPDGPPCGCGGRGCLERLASASAITQAYNAVAVRQVEGASDVLAALEHDPLARQVWQDAVEALADGLAMVVNLLAPARIVLGGGLAEAADDLVTPLRTAVSERSLIFDAPDLVVAAFGSRAGLVGAASLARRGAGAVR